MYARRTRQSLERTQVLCFVLLAVFAGAMQGCRNGEPATAPEQPLPFALSLPAGAQFAYNTWTLDQRYPQLPAVKSTTTWRVLSTQETYEGMSGVTIIAESSYTGVDTLYLASTPAGNLYIYGFLARITMQRLGSTIPSRWDLVASFSAGMGGSWTVGPADSLGQDIVHGNIAGASDYYSASVDGVTEVFPTYRIDLTGSSLFYSLWLSSTPNAIVRLLEEPGYETDGTLYELVMIKTGGRAS
jgi:hypothetical protein